MLKSRIGYELTPAHQRQTYNRRDAITRERYNCYVARGWESKSVEEQQSETSRPTKAAAPPLTPEQRATLQKKQGLLLDRKRTLQQLEHATQLQYRTMLKAALLELDRKLADLS